MNIELTRIGYVEVEKKNEERKSEEETAPPEMEMEERFKEFFFFFLCSGRGDWVFFYDFVLVNDMLFIFRPLNKSMQVDVDPSFDLLLKPIRCFMHNRPIF